MTKTSSTPKTTVTLAAKTPMMMDVTLACGCSEQVTFRTQVESIAAVMGSSERSCSDHAYVIVRQEQYSRGKMVETTTTYHHRDDRLPQDKALSLARRLYEDNARRSLLRLGQMYVTSTETPAGGNVVISNPLPKYEQVISYTIMPKRHLPN